jgi:hypothetical protein
VHIAHSGIHRPTRLRESKEERKREREGDTERVRKEERETER